MNLDINIYTVLVTKYEKLNTLPSDWNKIEDIKIKIELLSQALNKEKKLEDLSLYKSLIGEE